MSGQVAEDRHRLPFMAPGSGGRRELGSEHKLRIMEREGSRERWRCCGGTVANRDDFLSGCGPSTHDNVHNDVKVIVNDGVGKN